MDEATGLRALAQDVVKNVGFDILRSQGLLSNLVIKTITVGEYDYDTGERTNTSTQETNIEALVYRVSGTERRQEVEISYQFRMLMLSSSYPELKQTDIVTYNNNDYNIVRMEEDPTQSVIEINLAKVTP